VARSGNGLVGFAEVVRWLVDDNPGLDAGAIERRFVRCVRRGDFGLRQYGARRAVSNLIDLYGFANNAHPRALYWLRPHLSTAESRPLTMCSRRAIWAAWVSEQPGWVIPFELIEDDDAATGANAVKSAGGGAGVDASANPATEELATAEKLPEPVAKTTALKRKRPPPDQERVAEVTKALTKYAEEEGRKWPGQPARQRLRANDRDLRKIITKQTGATWREYSKGFGLLPDSYRTSQGRKQPEKK
jgi:hypothetical protein